jgi:hypothetical protein
MLHRCIKRGARIAGNVGKSARLNNIIDKSVMMAVWMPVVAAIYIQVLILTVSYNKTDATYNADNH